MKASANNQVIRGQNEGTGQQFGINGIGKYLVKKQSKAIREFIWTGILFFVVFYIGIRFGLQDGPFLFIMYLWVILISLITSVFFPIYIRNIIKKVILKIEFSASEIKIETKNDIINLKNIEIQKAIHGFKGFGKNHINGFILKDSKGTKEYWLIETFFNEIEDIENELNKYK